MSSVMEKVDTSLQEPLTIELSLEIKSQLEEYWNFYRRDVNFRRDMKLSWYATGNMITLNEATPYLNHVKLSRLCNKATALYIAPSGQQNNHLLLIVFGCIYKDWFLYYNNEPNFEFGRFFADPVRISSNGPQTVVEIVQSHKILCGQASQLLTSPDRGQSLSPASKLTTKTFKILPLFRAIILILHDLDGSAKGDANECISLDGYSQAQSVLMIKTGDEVHLSAPITFEHIKEQAFQLKRGDCNLDGIEVIRVSLAAAVDFITTLQQREDAAMPKKMIDLVDQSLCHRTFRSIMKTFLSVRMCGPRISCNKRINLDSRLFFLPKMF